jgi:N-acetylglutamate synthase-like GNAT family acetyltransferase
LSRQDLTKVFLIKRDYITQCGVSRSVNAEMLFNNQIGTSAKKKQKRIIPVYALQVLNKEEVEIKNIAVATEYQGQGIGKSLLADATDRAKARGFKKIITGSGDASTMPMSFYQKQGFKKYDRKKDFFSLNYPHPNSMTRAFNSKTW